MVKLCLECTHYDGVEWCKHPNAVNPVSGEPRLSVTTMRYNQQMCGMEGRWWSAQVSHLDPPRPLDGGTPRSAT